MPPKMISLAAPPAVSSTPPDANPWQLFVSTLLNCPPSQMFIEEHEQALHLTAAPILIHQLAQILRSPDAIRAGIHHRITLTSTVQAPLSPTSSIDTPPAPTDDKAPQILRNLFGKLLSQCGLHEEKLIAKGGYLSISIPESLLPIRKAAIPILRLALKNATFQHLRNTFQALGNETLEISGSIPRGILTESVDKIIGIRNDESSAEIYFDYHLLFQLVFPPPFEPCSTQEALDKLSISISKRHLVAYLSSVFSEGSFIHRESESTARPLCLSSSKTISKLTDQEDFKQELDLTQTMCTKRTLIHFFQSLSTQVNRFTVPAYEGRPHMASHTLALNEPVQVNGTHYHDHVMSQQPSQKVTGVVQGELAQTDTLEDSIREIGNPSTTASETVVNIPATTQPNSSKPAPVSTTDSWHSFFEAASGGSGKLSKICAIQ